MATQNCLSSVCRATEGLPGEESFSRPARSERRLFPTAIASTSFKVLQRPIETTQAFQATVVDIAGTITMINAPDGPEIHEGEAEALTYLRLKVDSESTDVAFVSADGAAIQATVLLDLSHTAKCLAEVLQAVGFSKPLAVRHQRQFVDQHLQRGFERKLRR